MILAKNTLGAGEIRGAQHDYHQDVATETLTQSNLAATIFDDALRFDAAHTDPDI